MGNSLEGRARKVGKQKLRASQHIRETEVKGEPAVKGNRS